MNPLEQLEQISRAHVPDGQWCRCGHEYPCDTVTLLTTYVTEPYILAVQRVYGMGFDTALDFVEKYASRPDQFIVARSIVRAVDEVRGWRDRSYPPDPNEQIVRESTEEAARIVDKFLDSGESPHGGIWGVRVGVWGKGKSHYVPESEFAQSIIVPICSKHKIEMERVQNIVDDRYVYFMCPRQPCDQWAQVKTS